MASRPNATNGYRALAKIGAQLDPSHLRLGFYVIEMPEGKILNINNHHTFEAGERGKAPMTEIWSAIINAANQGASDCGAACAEHSAMAGV